MPGQRPTPASIDAYIAAAPPLVRQILARIRRTVRRAAPEAQEITSYRMPAFRWNGILLYFGRLVRACARYANAKGNLRFPLDEPIPYRLIERIVRLRVRQNAGKAKRRPPRPGRRTITARKPGRS